MGKFGAVKIWQFIQFLVLAIFNFGEIVAAINDVMKAEKIG